jgi:hypothetical protein
MDLGSALDSRGRATFVADAHLDDGKWFVVWADEELTAFLELERRLAQRRLATALNYTGVRSLISDRDVKFHSIH